MLSNPQAFAEVERMLTEDGTIERFEAEHGPVTGRMMIDVGQVPSPLKDRVELGSDVVVFTGTFDFLHSAVGVAVDVRAGQPKSGVWVEEQKTGAYQPGKQWVDYFMSVLMDGIRDGAYRVPIYAFINDNASFEVYPAEPTSVG